MLRILPRPMRGYIRLEDIVTVHRTLLDLSPQQAVTSFISVLQEWPLFGATIFPVSVRLQELIRRLSEAAVTLLIFVF